MARNGFTLVELMVVVAVMGLMAGAVVMTVGVPRSSPSGDATRFASRVAAARDEAIVGGRPMSAWVTASGYGFERFAAGRWQPVATAPFDGGDWQQGTRVAFSRDSDGRARVRFDSLGMPDAATDVSLQRDGRRSRVRITANGDVTVD
ncbi:MAG: GspH/FimT family pseudopilin [Sphingomonas sp.]|nr:GspH/FimT family pseudopilin [Sphingomonas sp.]